MTEIQCERCNAVKHLKMFAPTGRPRHDGVQKIIQPCTLCRRKGREKLHRKRYVKKYLNVRARVLEHYAFGKMECKCCGEQGIVFLTLDHIFGDGAQERLKYGPRFWRSIITRGFPPRYQILCMNCNWAKWKMGECPHRTMKASTEVTS